MTTFLLLEHAEVRPADALQPCVPDGSHAIQRFAVEPVRFLEATEVMLQCAEVVGDHAFEATIVEGTGGQQRRFVTGASLVDTTTLVIEHAEIFSHARVAKPCVGEVQPRHEICFRAVQVGDGAFGQTARMQQSGVIGALASDPLQELEVELCRSAGGQNRTERKNGARRIALVVVGQRSLEHRKQVVPLAREGFRRRALAVEPLGVLLPVCKVVGRMFFGGGSFGSELDELFEGELADALVQGEASVARRAQQRTIAKILDRIQSVIAHDRFCRLE